MSNTDRNKRTGGGSIYKMTEREYNSASAMDRYPIARGVELGQILDSINLQPKFMRNDLRAALHTKELRAVESTIKDSLVSGARLDIVNIENAFYTPPQTTFVPSTPPQFQQQQQQQPSTPSSSSSSSSPSSPSSLHHKSDVVFSIVDVSPIDRDNSDDIFEPRWGILQRQGDLVAAEKWKVNRKGREYTYRVNYFEHVDGNSFYAKVVPLYASGVGVWAARKAKAFARGLGLG